MENKISYITVANYNIIEKDIIKIFYTSEEFYKLKNAVDNAINLMKDERVVTVIIYRQIENQPIEYYCQYNKNENE